MCSRSDLGNEDIATYVREKQAKCSTDERPAFVHGNTLMQQTMRELMKWFQATKKVLESQTVPYNGDTKTMSGSSFKLNERARGWLRFLWIKSTTKDDWSINGNPLPWWDKYSNAPMLNFPRFDCSESSYFLLLAADKTPAWREVYTKILDGLVMRHTSFWGAVDWLTQFGNDPDRKSYPSQLKGTLIPKHVFSNYNTPGWTGNGLEHPLEIVNGIQPDPIRANAMLFFKGWLTLLMGIRERVGGDEIWRNTWYMAGVDDEKFPWTYDAMAKQLSMQFPMNNGSGLN